MIQTFAGKTAVLTGAGSGFGLEVARIAAARGMNVVLMDVQADALAQAQAELSATGVQVMAKRVDVSQAAQMETLAAEVQTRFGAPHFVFNNAGVGSGGQRQKSRKWCLLPSSKTSFISTAIHKPWAMWLNACKPLCRHTTLLILLPSVLM
jgi:NAD(P)-dependent dehydrogenase (short-subunit alcohol dehydrogenase family)